MLSLIKYAARIQLKIRVISIVLLAAVYIALRFLTITASGALAQTILLAAGGIAAMIAAILVVTFNLIADASSLSHMFTAPQSYLFMLAPAPGWKLLLSRALPIAVFDGVCLILGSAGSAFLVSNISAFPVNILQPLIPSLILTGSLTFLIAILTVFLSCALAKSVFFRFRQHIVWGILSFLAIQYALSLLNLLLVPFTAHSGNILSLQLHITLGVNAGMIAYVILSLLKIGGLFAVTAYLLERKINI